MISIIIPCHNGKKYIKKSIKSCLNQSVDKEVILIDDASTDDGIAYIKDYLHEKYVCEDTEDGLIVKTTKHSNKGKDICKITIIRKEEHIGVAAARNLGINACKGEYVAFLDVDDWWENDKLKKQLKVLVEGDYSLCSTDRAMFSEDGLYQNKVIKSPKLITYKSLNKSNWINCSSVLISKDKVIDIPFEDGDFHEDYLLWLKIVKKYGTAYNICEPLLDYRNYRESKSGNKLKSMKMTYKTHRANGSNIIVTMYKMMCYIIFGLIKH